MLNLEVGQDSSYCPNPNIQNPIFQNSYSGGTHKQANKSKKFIFKSLSGELKKIKQVFLLSPFSKFSFHPFHPFLLSPYESPSGRYSMQYFPIYLTYYSVMAHAEPFPRIVPKAAKFENCQGCCIYRPCSPLCY